MDELSENAKKWLKILGNFGITTRGDEIKGWMYDSEDGQTCKTYFTADELFEFASALIEVANALKSG